MSEFSDSYHVRTDDPARVKQRLRQARLAGITFDPSNGWLTFIPYEEHRAFRREGIGEAFAHALSRLLAATVLHYHYSEDHGWGFTLARPAGPVSKFACWWDPEPAIESEQLDVDSLSPFATVEAVAPLLVKLDIAAAIEQRPAYRFAELLRLPAYKWLSPHLAQHHTADLIAQGGRKLGTKPPSAAERLRLPLRRRIEVPRPDLSAREALALVTPFVRSFGTAWRVESLHGNGRLTRGGRLEPGVGLWKFYYVNPGRSSADVVSVSLVFNGNLVFDGHMAMGLGAPEPTSAPPLSGNWLDSTEIAEIVGREPIPEGLDQNYGLSMSLRAIDDAPLIWTVRRGWSEYPRGSGISNHTLLVDAAGGDVIAETFERREGGKTTESRRRSRWEGAEWEDVPIDAGVASPAPTAR